MQRDMKARKAVLSRIVTLACDRRNERNQKILASHRQERLLIQLE